MIRTRFGHNIGSLIIRTRFRGPLYYIIIVRSPQNGIGNYLGSYIRVYEFGF